MRDQNLTGATRRFLLRLRYQLKKLGSGCEYFVMNEWSDGHRHMHILVRAEADVTSPMIRALWQKTLPGLYFTHHCAPVRCPAALARYIAKDLRDSSKKELAPAAFKGRIYSYSRAFFTKPAAALWQEQLQEWYPERRPDSADANALGSRHLAKRPGRSGRNRNGEGGRA
jgi:hypothetical protein